MGTSLEIHVQPFPGLWRTIQSFLVTFLRSLAISQTWSFCKWAVTYWSWEHMWTNLRNGQESNIMIWGAPWVVYSSQTLFFGSYNIVNSIKRWNETLQKFGLNQIDVLGGNKEQQIMWSMIWWVWNLNCQNTLQVHLNRLLLVNRRCALYASITKTA